MFEKQLGVCEFLNTEFDWVGYAQTFTTLVWVDVHFCHDCIDLINNYFIYCFKQILLVFGKKKKKAHSSTTSSSRKWHHSLEGKHQQTLSMDLMNPGMFCVSLKHLSCLVKWHKSVDQNSHISFFRWTPVLVHKGNESFPVN